MSSKTMLVTSDKKSYQAPQLKEYGDIRDITLQISGGGGAPGVPDPRNPAQRNPQRRNP